MSKPSPPTPQATNMAEVLKRSGTGQIGLPRRALGRTGLVAPVLGFGLSGALATPFVGKNLVTQLIRNAALHGVEFFDTAPFYGDGRAEYRLGQVLSSMPGRCALISTKGGTRRVGRRLVKDFSLEGLRHQLEESRTRLPRIDAFFLHGPSSSQLTRELIDGLLQLQAKGYFRYLGMAGRGSELDTAINTGAFDLIMAPAYKNLSPDELDRLEHARVSGLGVIGIECLAPAARGARLSLRPADLWYTARAIMRDRPSRDASANGPSAEDCLRWTLNSGLVDIAMITTTRPENLTANVAAARTCG